MEPFARRPVDRMPARRPIMGAALRPAAPQIGVNPAPVTPSRPATPSTPQYSQPQPTAQPSLLQPPTLPSTGASMDIRATPPARPMAAQPSGPAQPMVHHPTHHPKPMQQAVPAVHPTQTHTTLRQHAHPTAAAQQIGMQSAAHPSRSAQPQPHQQPVAHAPATHVTPHHAHTAHPHHKPTAESHNTKHHKEFHAAAHTGLVGFITFVIVGAAFLAPLLPGKVWQSAPGSSESFSTGDQNLDCLTTLGRITSTTSYDSKVGFPLTYNYSTTAKLSATCEGKVQHAVGGHTSQFSPLALLVDFALALGIAIGAAKIWRKIRSRND